MLKSFMFLSLRECEESLAIENLSHAFAAIGSESKRKLRTMDTYLSMEMLCIRHINIFRLAERIKVSR